MITGTEVDTEFEFGVDDIFNINDDHSSEPLAEILKDLNNNTTSDETPVIKKQLFEYETPSKNDNELIRFQDTGLFLSLTTKQFMQSIENPSYSVQVAYN